MNRALDLAIGGWQTSGALTLKEGFPLTIASPGNGLNYFGAGQHVDIVGKYKVSKQTRAAWFDNLQPPGPPTGWAFQPAAPWTLGNAPRYFSDLRAPGYKNWDMSIQKYFPIVEQWRLQFRLDMFNTFNHTNYYSPNTFMGGGFGTITQAWTPRQMQAGLKVYW